jgi:hypothetical protein
VSAYSDLILSDTPSLYWRLGASGTTDLSGNGRNGTAQNGLTIGGTAGALTGDADESTTFTGTSSHYISSTYDPYTPGSTRSFEGWAWRTGTGDDGLFGGPTVACQILSGTTNFDFYPAVTDLSRWISAWPGSDQWVHWVLIFTDSTNTAELYINGISKGTQPNTDAFAGGALAFGRGSGAPYWDGKMDEFAVYERALTGAEILEHYEMGVNGPVVTPVFGFTHVSTREGPPLRLSYDITTPGGQHFRWAEDEPKAENVPNGVSFGDTMPGGFDSFNATLPRKPGADYADLERLSTIRALSVGGEVVGEYRLNRSPRTSGDELAIGPEAEGWQAHLEDNKTARMIYRDIDLTAWTEASVQRKFNLNSSSFSPISPIGANPDATTGAPSLQLQIQTAAWGAGDQPIVESWYDAKGVLIGSIYYAWKKNSNVSAGPDGHNWRVQASTDDILTSADSTGDLQAAGPGSGTLATTSSNKDFAVVQYEITGAGGTANKDYSLYWTTLAVYGNHGLTKRGTEPSSGFYASDIIEHAVLTWAPLLNLTSDSISDTSFIFAHSSYTDPTTAAEIIRDTDRVHLNDWAVWEDRTFYYYPRGLRGRKWRARVGPSGLQEAGASVDRLWNGIIVRYQDVTGESRTIGPAGSGADTTSTDLLDTDATNPANQLGIRRWDLLDMGMICTPAQATEVGRRFLEESRALDTSGSATLTGWVEDDKGVRHPYTHVRSGDTISFTDAADTAYRRIVRTQKSLDSRSVAIDLDAPPDGLDALLERLGALLVPLGL